MPATLLCRKLYQGITNMIKNFKPGDRIIYNGTYPQCYKNNRYIKVGEVLIFKCYTQSYPNVDMFLDAVNDTRWLEECFDLVQKNMPKNYNKEMV